MTPEAFNFVFGLLNLTDITEAFVGGYSDSSQPNCKAAGATVFPFFSKSCSSRERSEVVQQGLTEMT